MPTVADVAGFLNEFAPPVLAESWDNVGLLVGSHAQPVMRLMTCLTVTPESVREAIARSAELIVTHHPLLFRPLKRITSETPEGRMLLDLTAARISVYSPHTAFDSAERGINARIAEGLGLVDVWPLRPIADSGIGAGRYGRLPAAITLAELAERVKQWLNIAHVQAVGALDQSIQSVAVACGSAGEFVAEAKEAGCDCLVTGETRFHTYLEAEALDISLVLAGHFASERFAVEQLATVLAQQFPSLEVWASQAERDPVHWL